MKPTSFAALTLAAPLLLSALLPVTLAGPTIHWGQYATVQSETDGNGLYTYTLTAGTDPLTFFAGQDDMLELTFYGMQDLYDTPGWESASLPDDVICWTYTGTDPLVLSETPIVFSAQSSITASQVWPVDLSNPSAPQAFVIGEADPEPYGLDVFQPFSFVAPVPEPSTIGLFVIGGITAALAARRRRVSTSV